MCFMAKYVSASRMEIRQILLAQCCQAGRSLSCEGREVNHEIVQTLSTFPLLLGLLMAVLEHIRFEELYQQSHVVDLENLLPAGHDHLENYRVDHSFPFKQKQIKDDCSKLDRGIVDHQRQIILSKAHVQVSLKFPHVP